MQLYLSVYIKARRLCDYFKARVEGKKSVCYTSIAIRPFRSPTMELKNYYQSNT